MLGLTLPNLLKPTWKHSNGKSYPTGRIPQVLRRPIITYSGRWLTSAHIEKWLDLWIGSKDEHFYSKGIRALPEIWVKVVDNDHFCTIKLHFHQKTAGTLIAHLI